MASGHIRKRGKRWYYVHGVDDPATGRRRQKWHGGYPSRQDAERALRESLTSLDTGTWTEPTKLTYATYVNEIWLPQMWDQVESSTLESYAPQHARPCVASNRSGPPPEAHRRPPQRALPQPACRTDRRPQEHQPAPRTGQLRPHPRATASRRHIPAHRGADPRRVPDGAHNHQVGSGPDRRPGSTVRATARTRCWRFARFATSTPSSAARYVRRSGWATSRAIRLPTRSRPAARRLPWSEQSGPPSRPGPSSLGHVRSSFASGRHGRSSPRPETAEERTWVLDGRTSISIEQPHGSPGR